MKNTQLLILALFGFLFLQSCSEGFNSQQALKAIDPIQNPDQDGFDTPPSQVEETWNKAQIELEGLVSGGAYDGQVLIEVDKPRQSLILWVPLPPIFLAPITPISIEKLKGIQVEYRKNPDGAYQMAIIVPIKHILKNSQLSNYGTLPSGDPIPFMPSGESRGFAINFSNKENYRLHFYFVANSVGVFVETPDWKLPDELSYIPTLGFPIKNKNQTQVVGYLGIIPNKGIHSSGVFISSRIPRELAFQIDQILRY